MAVCFPQFGPRGSLPQHGFVRKSNDWTASDPQTDPNGDTRMVFKHTDTTETRASAWPHTFEATYEVVLGGETLATCLRVHNTGNEAFEFTCALHTYFRVSDISAIAIKGLKVWFSRLFIGFLLWPRLFTLCVDACLAGHVMHVCDGIRKCQQDQSWSNLQRMLSPLKGVHRCPV
jgi:hypothetical protein